MCILSFLGAIILARDENTLLSNAGKKREYLCMYAMGGWLKLSNLLLSFASSSVIVICMRFPILHCQWVSEVRPSLTYLWQYWNWGQITNRQTLSWFLKTISPLIRLPATYAYRLICMVILLRGSKYSRQSTFDRSASFIMFSVTSPHPSIRIPRIIIIRY